MKPESVTVRCQAPDRGYVIDIAQGWIEAGLAPVTMPNGGMWLLPASAIESFEVEEAQGPRTRSA